MQDIAVQRFDVGTVGKFRIGHDRRRIAVDQNDFEALLFQYFAGLYARIIELAALPDDDRPGADQHNFPQIRPFRHVSFSS